MSGFVYLVHIYWVSFARHVAKAIIQTEAFILEVISLKKRLEREIEVSGENIVLTMFFLFLFFLHRLRTIQEIKGYKVARLINTLCIRPALLHSVKYLKFLGVYRMYLYNNSFNNTFRVCIFIHF